MKLLIDTNVLISAFVYDGKPLSLLETLLKEGHNVYVSEYIEREFREKVTQKWRRREQDILSEYARIRLPVLKSTENVYHVLRDLDDDPILSDAIYHNVDLILSGDKDFLESGLRHPKIMSVSMLYNMLFGEKSHA